jgi:hypothetical protein
MDKAEKDIKRKEGIIHSMTPQERRKPELIKATRKRRIAAGAGVQVQEVNRLLKEFEQMQGMMKKMKGGGLMKLMKQDGRHEGPAVTNLVHDMLNPLISHTAGAACARRIGQTREAVRLVAPPPFGDGLHRRAQTLGDHSARLSIRAAQHNSHAQLLVCWCFAYAQARLEL